MGKEFLRDQLKARGGPLAIASNHWPAALRHKQSASMTRRLESAFAIRKLLGLLRHNL